MSDRPLPLSVWGQNGPRPWWAASLDRILGLHAMNELHQSLPQNVGVDEFLEAFFEMRKLRIVLQETGAGEIPVSGPLLVVANHPFGGVEGLGLARLLLKQRPDTRVMANSLLSRIVELRKLFLPVNPFGGVEGRRQSVPGLRASLAWLREGGVLVIFPAGEVAHRRWTHWRVEESKWSPVVSRLQRRVGCPVLPFRVEGYNRLRFHLVGLLHPMLRTALLAREFLAFKDRQLRIQRGRLIPAEEMFRVGNDREATDFLYRLVEKMGERR